MEESTTGHADDRKCCNRVHTPFYPMEDSSMEHGATGPEWGGMGVRIPRNTQGKQSQGELLRTILILEEKIAAKESAEKELNRTIFELERSNRELQEFAFVASHDLRAPLRKIQSFSEALEEECGPDMNENCRIYTQSMRKIAGRMRELIDELLQYSQVTNRELKIQELDLKEIVQEVVSDMEPYILEECAHVEMNIDVGVEGDPIQFRQVFQNLIHNAIKFRGIDAPIVKISGEVQIDPFGSKGEKALAMVEIRLEDNGIGFDEADMEQVFAPFKRLHPVHEYEGTGMGLPICKRIAIRHGGELTARSQPGKGSVFIMRLPLKQPSGQAANQSDRHLC